MSDVYWSTQNLTPAAPVLQNNTVGDQQNNVIQNIPGAAAGAIPPGWVASAQAVYPRYGSAGFPSVPLASLNINDFPTWHSEHQRQRIVANGGFHQIPPVGTPEAYFVLVDGGTRPVNLMNLTLIDYARLSAADKAALRTPLQTLGVAARLGLTTDKTATLNGIDAQIGVINLATGFSAADRATFTGQLAILRRAVVASDMIIPDTIASELKAISDRFDRARTFLQTRQSVGFSSIEFIRNENAGGVNGRYIGYMTGIEARAFAVSSDDGATITAGFAEFMRAERAILAMQTRREALSAPTAIPDPKLDLANLIFQFQLLYEAEAEGIADGGTEEIRQLHKLLQDYGIMQRLVQETIKSYDASEADQKRRFMNLGGRDDGGVQGEQRARHDGNHDMSIRFFFDGGLGSVVSPGGGADGSDQLALTTYRETAGYHWFHLQATPPGGRLTQYPGSDSGANPPFEGELIRDRYSRSWDNSDRNDHGKQNGGLTADEMEIFGMFSDDTWAATYRQAHPMEALYGVTRPKQKFSAENEEGNGGLDLVRKTVWDSFATQLSDAVTLLNQQNQLKQNEIESATRQQNRHFDLGNNALKKMNDLLMTIGRM